MLEKVVKAYDVRGIYPDLLNEDIAWRLGSATARYLTEKLVPADGRQPGTFRIAIGRDMRKSSPALRDAFVEGARSTGVGVIDIGMIDTSQLYFAINHLDTCGGVQVTASHNPPQYNGFKIAGPKGKPVGSDSGLLEIRDLAAQTKREPSDANGSLESSDLSRAYTDFVRGFLRPLRPLRVVVDASNGMAGKWMPVLFDGIENLEIVELNMSHDGAFAHDPNPLVESNLRQLQKEVRRAQADFGACFDGDADRCIFVDEQTRTVRCDLLTALLAREFLRESPGSAVVYDLRASRVVAEEIEKAGGIPVRDRVGHAFMKKTLAQRDGVFGGELSGHFYFRDNWYCDSGMLAFVWVLNVVSEAKKPLSQLIQPLERYHGSGERNFQNDKQDETIERLAQRYADAKIDHLDGITVQYGDWWFNVRKSNTEPLLRLNLEAENEALLTEKLAELAEQLGTPVDH